MFRIIDIMHDILTDEREYTRRTMEKGLGIHNIDRAQIAALTVIDPETGAARADKGKLRYDLLPPGPIQDLVEVLTYGSRKYADHNWTKGGGMAWTRCYAALMRHLQAWYQGEDTDPESGLPHLSHAMFNVMALRYYETTNQVKDDRPFKNE